MEERDWICQVRPSNPRGGKNLQPEDFFRPKECSHIVFEYGISPKAFSPSSKTIILENNYFCAVRDYVRYTENRTTHKCSTPTAVHICLPGAVEGREVLFHSPQIDPLTIR